MATDTINENPFANYGNLVTGARFIGRQKEIKQIHNRVLASNGGNISIVGLPRIGKSSLVWNALIQQKETLIDEKKVIVEINIGSLDNSRDLFKAMASEVIENLENIIDNLQLELLNKILDKFSPDISDYEFRSNLYKFLRRVKKTSYQIIYIFEEFDKGGDFLTLSDFQALREIGTRPEYSVNFVTISRRTIQELEAKNGALSRFYAIFNYLNLSMFSNGDTDKYWKRLHELGIDIPQSYKEKTHSLVGEHPFLMDIVNYSVFNEYLNSIDQELYPILSQIFEGNNLNLLYHFDEIIDLMKDEKLERKLFQSIVGPVFDLDIKSIEKLVRFGIIKNVELGEDKQIKFDGFSDYFSDYLRIKREEFPIWELWSKTEIELRELIKYYLVSKYGENWVEGFVRKNPKKEKSIETLQLIKSKNQKTFGERSSKHLVDYTYPADMYNIFMQTDWAWFNQVLKDSNKEWRGKFNHLAVVRNPIAHNNTPFITSQQKNLAVDYCNLILERISKWKEGIKTGDNTKG